jgi:hypothetical protein
VLTASQSCDVEYYGVLEADKALEMGFCRRSSRSSEGKARPAASVYQKGRSVVLLRSEEAGVGLLLQRVRVAAAVQRVDKLRGAVDVEADSMDAGGPGYRSRGWQRPRKECWREGAGRDVLRDGGAGPRLIGTAGQGFWKRAGAGMLDNGRREPGPGCHSPGCAARASQKADAPAAEARDWLQRDPPQQTGIAAPNQGCVCDQATMTAKRQRPAGPAQSGDGRGAKVCKSLVRDATAAAVPRS